MGRACPWGVAAAGITIDRIRDRGLWVFDLGAPLLDTARPVGSGTSEWHGVLRGRRRARRTVRADHRLRFGEAVDREVASVNAASCTCALTGHTCLTGRSGHRSWLKVRFESGWRNGPGRAWPGLPSTRTEAGPGRVGYARHPANVSEALFRRIHAADRPTRTAGSPPTLRRTGSAPPSGGARRVQELRASGRTPASGPLPVPGRT
jgi:hypothetical protein